MAPITPATKARVSQPSTIARMPTGNTSSSPSRMVSRKMLPEVKPSVLSTPISWIRSRTDCAMVWPVTSRIMNTTALRIRVTIRPMLPNCCAYSCAKAASVLVLVSAGEFSNSASMEAIRLSSGSAPSPLDTYQPTVPLPKARASSK